MFGGRSRNPTARAGGADARIARPAVRREDGRQDQGRYAGEPEPRCLWRPRSDSGLRIPSRQAHQSRGDVGRAEPDDQEQAVSGEAAAHRQDPRLVATLGADERTAIVWIAAHSPQAKGRAERSFHTARDRAAKSLRVATSRRDTFPRFLPDRQQTSRAAQSVAQAKGRQDRLAKGPVVCRSASKPCG